MAEFGRKVVLPVPREKLQKINGYQRCMPRRTGVLLLGVHTSRPTANHEKLLGFVTSVVHIG